MALSIQIVISDYNISTGLPADQDSLPEKSACEPVIPSVIDQSQAMSVGAESTSVEEESLAGSQRRFEREEEESISDSQMFGEEDSTTESLPMYTPEKENLKNNLTSFTESQKEKKREKDSQADRDEEVFIDVTDSQTQGEEEFIVKLQRTNQSKGYIYNNYKFHLNAKRKKHLVWRCASYDKNQCPARFFTTLNFEPLKQKNTHKSTCEPVISLDRTHPQLISEGARSFAGLQSACEDNLKSINESQKERKREDSQSGNLGQYSNL